MPIARRLSGLAALAALSAISCGSTTPPASTGNAGSASTAGATSGAGGSSSNGSGNTATGGAAGKAATGGSAMADGGSAAGALTGGASNNGGASSAGSSAAGVGGADLPSYAGPGVDCFMGLADDKANRCGVAQTCCEERFGRTECQPDIGSCAPCSKAGECTVISCDEPADCPGGACCATLGTGGGGVEFARLTCQPSCNQGQYVICATLADCPSEYHECGISSMLIHRCFH